MMLGDEQIHLYLSREHCSANKLEGLGQGQSARAYVVHDFAATAAALPQAPELPPADLFWDKSKGLMTGLCIEWVFIDLNSVG